MGPAVQHLTRAHVEVLDELAPWGQGFTPDAGYCRPGSWEWHTETGQAQRELLAALGYETSPDPARPWRVIWTRPASTRVLDVCDRCEGHGGGARGPCGRCEGSRVITLDDPPKDDPRAFDGWTRAVRWSGWFIRVLRYGEWLTLTVHEEDGAFLGHSQPGYLIDPEPQGSCHGDWSCPETAVDSMLGWAEGV
ncbi:MAG: hypothetical protein H6739_07745 [Alphaproteobacteria bacterium]|nr:hypothetical protein [Alphaproteobacteria bacterium]